MVKSDTKDDSVSAEDLPDELDAGTQLLGGQYTIEKFLNSGGFGITYLARDSLDRRVVIKECFPEAVCRRTSSKVRPRSRAHQASFASVVKLFEQEARSQSKLVHSNIVGVHQVFKDNDTAYMALDFVDGKDLLERIESKEALEPANVENWLRQMLDAVGFIHQGNMLHRDISPDNILVDTQSNPILIDFGAARAQASENERVLSTMRVVKDGYSPQEFYVSGSDQTPSSDLYALAASFYHVISGKMPTDSQKRLTSIAQQQGDLYEPLAGRIPGYPENLLASVDKAISVLPKNRYQSAQEWLDAIDGKEPVAAVEQPTSKATNAATGTTTAEKSGKSKPMLWVASSAVALIAAGAVFVMTQGGTETADPVDVAATAPAPVAQAPAPTEPTQAAQVQTTDSTPAPAIVAVDPREIPAYNNPLVASAEWSVDTPFETRETAVKEGTFARVMLVNSGLGADIKAWLTTGSVIYSIDGRLVYDDESIASAIRDSVEELSQEETVNVSLRIRTARNNDIEEQDITLPVVRSVELENGLTFISSPTDEGWETTVKNLPSTLSSTLQVGDVIVSEAQTGAAIEIPADIEASLFKLHESDAPTAYFTVMRDGSSQDATVDFQEN